MVDGDGGPRQLLARFAGAHVLEDDQVGLERLGPARLEFLEPEVGALHQEGLSRLVQQPVPELGAVGVALDEPGGDAAVLRHLRRALEGGEPAVDPAAEDQQERNVHHPDAESRVAPALGEEVAVLRLHAVAALAQQLRDLVRRMARRRCGHLEAQPHHPIQAPLGIAHQEPDAREPLERAGDQIQRQREHQRREPPGVEQVVELEPAVGSQGPGPAGEGALDVGEGVVLRVDESAGDHPEEEQQQIRERQAQRAEEPPDDFDDGVALLLGGRRKLGNFADGGGRRPRGYQLFCG